MLDVCLLGTSGMKPIPGRWLTSLWAEISGMAVLVDCGEGTQVAIAQAGMHVKRIDAIFLTHLHFDHFGGLPGLLLAMHNANRTEPVMLVGPVGTAQVASTLRIVAPSFAFGLDVHEISGAQERFCLPNALEVTAFRVEHRIPCYGYAIEAKRARKFLPEKAKALGVPVNLWGRLQHGQKVEVDGAAIEPSLVLGEERRGIKLAYCTDSRPVKSISEHAKGADLFICEGMYGDDSLQEKAEEHKHMTMREAAGLAREANAKELWLTHYSPSMMDPDNYVANARKAFENMRAAKDGDKAVLNFKD